MNEFRKCTIARTALHIPGQTVSFSGLRATERSAGCLHLTEPGGEFGLPFGRWGDPPTPEIEALHQPVPALLLTAPIGTSSADMAVAAARELLQGFTESELAGIVAIIHCRASVNENISEAVACRLQHELALSAPLVFSVSQNLCSVFVALRLASAILHGHAGPQRVLIVASDKWTFPYLRSFHPWLVFEDSAAAMLIEPADRPGWQVNALRISADLNAQDPFRAPQALLQGLENHGMEEVRQLLGDCGISAADLAFVVHPNINPAAREQLMQCTGLAHLPGLTDQHRDGHLASAETIANLHYAQHRCSTRPEQQGLLWAVGLHGEFGCCVLSSGSVPVAASEAHHQ